LEVKAIWSICLTSEAYLFYQKIFEQ